jgi:hypothetical protein
MYLRVVRFTDVNAERVADLASRIEQAEGPPPGVPATGIQILLDAAQQTAVVVQMFDTTEEMQAGDRVMGNMDPAETPGTRASVDMCELLVDRR